MVRDYVQGGGVSNARVLDAMRNTPRHIFVPQRSRRRAYADVALPIGSGQTISSPYIVARMTEQLNPQSSDRVLEIGTGSGYQAAVLSSLVKDVYTIEIVSELGERAADILRQQKYENVHVRVGDGYQGWPAAAPFDKILVTCSPENVPAPLVEQLVEGGQLVVPVGERFQQVLYRFTKKNGELQRERVESTFFVPMTGKAESERANLIDERTPDVVNGGFEDKTRDGAPLGWFYLRNGKLERDPRSPEKLQYLSLTKQGRAPAHAMQPLGIDGGRIHELTVSFWSRGEGIRSSLIALERSQLRIEYYDSARRLCGESTVPVPTGTYEWRQFTQHVEVPGEAKVAMLQIGLFGVGGHISFDDVRVVVRASHDDKDVLPAR